VLIMQGDGNLVLYQVIGAPPITGSSLNGNPLRFSSPARMKAAWKSTFKSST
jgi:hypothetical protein